MWKSPSSYCSRKSWRVQVADSIKSKPSQSHLFIGKSDMSDRSCVDCNSCLFYIKDHKSKSNHHPSTSDSEDISISALQNAHFDLFCGFALWSQTWNGVWIPAASCIVFFPKLVFLQNLSISYLDLFFWWFFLRIRSHGKPSWKPPLRRTFSGAFLCKSTPWNINGWNLQITHEKKGKMIWTKPRWLCAKMLIFRSVV